MKFSVIDTKTGQAPDTRWIALHETWAEALIHSEMRGFALLDDGTLLLLDSYGVYVPCPEGRFKVTMLG